MKAKKSLGQNFLHAKRFIHKAIATMDIKADDIVVEIGPGKGALTAELLNANPQQLIAIETDERMIEFLSERFADEIKNNQLILVHNDVLTVDIAKLTENQPYKLIGNLPFYITGAIFKKFLTDHHQPSSITAITQKEVTDRIVARDNKESILSLSVKAYGTPRYLAKIPKQSFNPAPAVDAGLLHISDISRNNFTSPEHEEMFFTLVKAGFAHKRKKLASNIKNILGEQTEDIFARHELDTNTRAEDVPLGIWLSITKIR